ncbi:DNA gyrase subunit A [Notoacmeibacter sp. MSK16QG-6]|uniref:DNA gyrase subunit A n=1 Tax=Notoacmeibacter sp. MSK16QG-6 TaxID=2957982 RepID=UPI00209FC523|nr:DNA gyrase subunit A [Notoacmeibacter sp. MSK16QG-6]
MTDQTIPPGGSDGEGFEPISIIEEMQRSYLDYAMSVIVSRALPDVRDGLKPVHRRILYAMNESGYHWNRKYVKSSRIVGDVMGKYHPHGDAAIYDSMVRMAQDWSLRDPLIDGQGNFGSIDNDPPAAMRYTESRLAKLAHELLEDIDKDTVDFQDNYDGSESEPKVLPARFPNLLVNGSGGIAVGMATNIPPHNLGELVDGCVALIDDPAIDIERLTEIIPGPDFPTGGLILGRAGIRSAYESGRGSIPMRGRATIEQLRGDRECIAITEMPYQVNKAGMIEKMAELVRDKRIEGISDIRDESDRSGYRVVVELKRDASADVVLNQLYRFTPLQTSFGANMVALNGGKPEQMNLLDMLRAFVAFREEVVTRRTKFLLNKARDRAHVLVGLAIAVANIDEVIALIRNAPNPQIAREQLMERHWPAKDVAPLIELIDDPRHKLNDDGTYNLSEEQARAILELRLQRLTALGRDEIADELETIATEIRDYLDILSSRARVQQIIKDELHAVKEEFGTPRRTEICDYVADMDDEDLIAREDMVVTVSHSGYIKRVPLSIYRAQRRGGKGRSGMSTKDEDFVTRLFVANTHTPVLFFSSRGIVYKEKVWRLPVGTPQSRGKFLRNMLPLQDNERITSIMPLPEDEESWGELDVMFATTRGTVRRNKLSDFVQVNRNGKIAMKFDEGDDTEILAVETCTDTDDVMMTTAGGQCIRFRVGDVRVFGGRSSQGVRGINLAADDTVISMAILSGTDASGDERAAYLRQSMAERRLGDAEDMETTTDDEVVSDDFVLDADRYREMADREQWVLTISSRGFGKLSSSHDFRVTGRGGKGIRATAAGREKEIGKLVACFPIETADQIMLVTNGGQVIRVPVSGIRLAGRATKGVTIFRTSEEEKVVSVERIPEPEEEEAVDDTIVSSDVDEVSPPNPTATASVDQSDPDDQTE